MTNGPEERRRGSWWRFDPLDHWHGINGFIDGLLGAPWPAGITEWTYDANREVGAEIRAEIGAAKARSLAKADMAWRQLAVHRLRALGWSNERIAKAAVADDLETEIRIYKRRMEEHDHERR